MLTTLAGVMAAIWSAKESESQRARQQATADSLKSSLEATAQQATVDQAIDDVTEAAWRSAFLNVDSLQVTDTTLKTALQTQAKISDDGAEDDLRVAAEGRERCELRGRPAQACAGQRRVGQG